MSLINLGDHIILVKLIVTLNIFSDMGLFDFLFKRKSDLKSNQKSQLTTPKELEPGKTINIKLQNLTPNEVTQCERGRSIKFWNKPNSNEILIYRHGSMGGDGLLGVYNGKYHNLLMNHLKNDDLQNSRITSKSRTSLVIDYWIESREELDRVIAEQEKEQEKERGKILLEKLNSVPKNKMRYYSYHGPIEIYDTNKKYRKGQKFKVELMDKDFYIKNQTEMTVHLVGSSGNKVGAFSVRHYDTRFFNMLRFGFNGYNLEAEIIGRGELRVNILG